MTIPLSEHNQTIAAVFVLVCLLWALIVALARGWS